MGLEIRIKRVIFEDGRNYKNQEVFQMSESNLPAELVMLKYIAPYGIFKHGPVKVLAHTQTRFQTLDILDSGILGKILLLDNSLQSCTSDEFLYHEPLVQPSCICHGAPESVLVLGGGEGATVREVLKWKSVKRVVMVDIDEEAVELCRKFMPEMSKGSFEDLRTELIIGDAFEFFDKSNEKWDIIISDLTEPVEEGISAKLFTKEYFERCASALKPGGFFAMHSGPVSPTEIGMLHVRLANTLREVFGNILHYTSYIPSFGATWGFVMGRPDGAIVIPDCRETDKILAECTNGDFKMLDGQALPGVMCTPKYVRQAVENETGVFSLAAPPDFRFIEVKEELGYRYLKK